MITPTKWDEAPSGFVLRKVDDQEPIVAWCKKNGAILLRMELDENERRQLIEGNPLYLVIMGGNPNPFALSANLAEVANIARNYGIEG